MDLLYGRISWATSHLTDTCDGYDVEVRYSCIHDEDLPFPTEEEFKRVCELVGLVRKKYLFKEIPTKIFSSFVHFTSRVCKCSWTRTSPWTTA